MTVRELIDALQAIAAQHGDGLPVEDIHGVEYTNVEYNDDEYPCAVIES